METYRHYRKPQFDYKRGWVRFEIQPEIYNAVLNFSKGFRKYELKTAMEFTSQYSMRFYELMSGQQTPLTYTIEDLKSCSAYKINTSVAQTLSNGL